jgi:hypothetical protein
MTIHNRISGVWRTLTSFYVKVSGTWRPTTAIYIKDLGVWRSVGSSTPDAPTLTQTNSANGNYTLDTSAFSSPVVPTTHASTDWQITSASDTSFSSPIYQSLSDTSNKLTINLHDKGFTDGYQLIARVRHRAADGGIGFWSTTYPIYTPPSVSFSGVSASHTYTLTSYSGLSATHSSSDYALTTTADTSFSSTAYSATSQSALSYANTTLLSSSSNYLVKVRANFSDGRSSPYKTSTRTTSSYTYTITYTSNTTMVTPFTPTSNGGASVNVYVEVAGGKGIRGDRNICNSSGRGKKFGMTLTLTGNTSYYAYPIGVTGGSAASCSANGGGNAAVFATTSNGAYLIAGGGGGVRQSCHDCSQPMDGCGGGSGSTGAGSGNCGTCCGCGGNGSTWGGSRLGSGTSQDYAESGYNPSTGEGGCGGGNSWSYGSLSLNDWNDQASYVYISWS